MTLGAVVPCGGGLTVAQRGAGGPKGGSNLVVEDLARGLVEGGRDAREPGWIRPEGTIPLPKSP